MKNPYRWDNLTSPQIKKLSEEGAIVLVPVGSTEQHGPHLPVGTDALMATAMSEKMAAALCGKGVPCVVAPTIAVANSTHPYELCRLPHPAARDLSGPAAGLLPQHRYGFRKILLVNGHGKHRSHNTALISINEELGFGVFTGYWKPALRQNRRSWRPRRA